MANPAQLLAFIKHQMDDLERIVKEMQANYEAFEILQRKEWRKRQRTHRRNRPGFQGVKIKCNDDAR